MEKEIVEKILRETETGYDSIAEKFSQTRKHFWRGLEFIADFASPDSKVLDFGCGNGRLLELIFDKKPDYYGVDVSQGLLEFAQEKHPNAHFSKIDPSQRSLAFDAGFFNTIYSIAVFHHFPSKQYRQDVAKEFYRVTKDDGYVVITVWNLWQRNYLKNILKNWLNKIKGNKELDWNDCYISFTDNKGRKFQRFHHAFTKRELKRLFKEVGFSVQQCKVVNGRNILLIAKKR